MENKNIDNIDNKDDEKQLEPLLDPKNARFTIHPIVYDDIWQMYKKQQNCYWKAEEIDFTKDYDDFSKLDADEQHFIKMVLAFFASSDGIVNFNLRERFLKDVQVTEAQVVYGWQMMMENIHCVSHDTQILTDVGYIQIGSHINQNINVWNGKEFSNTTVRFTGDAELYRVELSNGMYLDCTNQHKWFIHDDEDTDNKKIVFTEDLKTNDIIHDYKLPMINPKDPDYFMHPYIHAFFSSCGIHDTNGDLVILLPKAKEELLEVLNLDHMSDKYGSYISFNVRNHINKPKLFVPINYSIETKIKWLSGLCDANTKEKILNPNLKFLQDVQLMLTGLGVNSCITETTTLHELSFPHNKLDHFNPKYINKDEYVHVNVTTVKNVTKLPGIHKTYCFNEPNEHAGIFNGILTGQSEVYSEMLTKIVKDKTEKDKLFDAIRTVKSVKLMADWTFKWIESDKPFAYRIYAFAIVEGIFFSGAFAAIFWLKKYRSKGEHFMNGLIKSNEFIARDEGLHCEFAVMLYLMLKTRVPKEDVYQIMKEAVDISCTFTDDAIPCKLIGMNQDLMKQYLEYIADRLLSMMKYQKLYNTSNPFKFMESIGLSKKTNFFEHRPTEYQSANNSENVNKKLVVLDLF